MDLLKYIRSIPAISTHEHIGSIASVGMDTLAGFTVDAHVGASCTETGLETPLVGKHRQILLPAQWYKAYLQKRGNRKRHMQAVRHHAGTYTRQEKETVLLGCLPHALVA